MEAPPLPPTPAGPTTAEGWSLPANTALSAALPPPAGVWEEVDVTSIRETDPLSVTLVRMAQWPRGLSEKMERIYSSDDSEGL